MATFNNGESGSSVRAKINAVLQHADGTAGEIVFNDAGADVDFRIESDTNANAFFLDGATGNLGIGTTSPGQRLQVQGSAFADTILRISTASGTIGNFKRLEFTDNAGGTVTGSITSFGSAQGSGNDSDMAFDVNGSERMRIDSSGNVGIGVTPSAWASSVRALETITGAFYSFASGSVSNFYMMSNSFVNSGGTPTYKQSAAAAQYLQTAGQHQWYTAPSGTAGNAITFTQAMTLNASGSLGIGTTSPSTIYTRTAHISSAGASGVVFTNTITPKTYAIGTNGTILQFYDVTAGAERMQIDSNGNLGIGVAPTGASKLRISGLPTSSAGLSAGDVWNDGGTLKIV